MKYLQMKTIFFAVLLSILKLHQTALIADDDFTDNSNQNGESIYITEYNDNDYDEDRLNEIKIQEGVLKRNAYSTDTNALYDKFLRYMSESSNKKMPKLWSKFDFNSDNTIDETFDDTVTEKRNEINTNAYDVIKKYLRIAKPLPKTLTRIDIDENTPDFSTNLKSLKQKLERLNKRFLSFKTIEE